MIKKFTFVFFLTLISQLISIFSISYIVKGNATSSFIEFVSMLDSSYVLINTILSFGIIQIATREIVVVDNWKKVVENTQNIRMTFSLVLFVLGLILYFLTENLYFFTFTLSPLIALNINYLFYAKGNAKTATINSSIRIFIISIPLIFIGEFQYFSIKIYFVFFVLGLIYVAFSSNIASKVNVKIKLISSFYKDYFINVGVGITDLAIIFLEFGILFIAAFFYKSVIVSNAYILIKIITLIKGFQRMIFQVFYNQLIEKKIAYFLDQIIFFVGFSFFLISFFFSEELLMLLYLKKDVVLQNNLIIFSLALLLASILLASMARTLIIKNDKVYIKSYILSLIFSVATLFLLSLTKFKIYGVSIALLVGEIILFISFIINIYKDIYLDKYMINFFKYIILFSVYYLFSRIFETQISFFIIMFFQILLAIAFIFRNKKVIL